MRASRRGIPELSTLSGAMETAERTDLPTLVRAVGEDNILFETDFPHPTCLYPDPLTSAHENMRELSETAKNKILGGNAAKLYRL